MATNKRPQPVEFACPEDEHIFKKIGSIFVHNILPDNVLPLFHLFDTNVLVKRDIEKVRAVTTAKGRHEGAAELLSLLPSYRGWFPCLLKVLRHNDVKQSFLADEMEKAIGLLSASPSYNSEFKLADNHPESQCRSARSSRDEIMNEVKAERVRTSLGNHEAEVSLTGEDGLHQCLLMCPKNPGHQNFIPINEFNMEHLPSHYRDKLIVDYVKATSDVTCCLSVLRISEDRPKLWPESDQTSPLSIQKGEESMMTGFTEDRPETCPDTDQASLLSNYQEHNFLMTGTGWVSDVIRYSLTDKIYCECEECLGTQTPKKTWGVVYLRTACHVVYNDEEARHTKCQFFCDSHDTGINKVCTLTGLTIVGTDIKRDLCWMMYVTHDVKLLETFDKMCIHWRDLRHKVITKYRYLLKMSSDAVCDSNVKHDLCIIVSHPHGCSKTVTVGKWTKKQLVRKDGSGNEEIKYSYDTPTCRGSGGAPVITLVDDMKLQYGLSHPQAHNQVPLGGQEARMNSTKEFAVNMAIILCEKNPGHQNFICVQDFNITHLPTRYRDNFIVNYVESMSGLTCRLTVGDISKDRQDIFPGREQVTSGTGWVMSVVKFTDGENGDCPCKECCETVADTPKKTWGVVYLKTASHVVHSDEVARHTKFHFFYDSHEATLATVPTLTGSEVKNRSIDGDSCVMMSVTHDVDLLDILYNKSLEWLEQRSKVHYKHLHSKSSGTGCNNDVKHDLCIIVSHPHGCSKTVTVGKWTQKHLVRKDNSGNEEIKYSYNTPTCPGSSGSPVIILEDDIKLQCGLSPLPPHSEGGPGNDNSSGVIVEQAS